MPKDKTSDYAIAAKKIKAAGLQKLRWYCQMCKKQCRDENGFKCHITSESHQRQMGIFAQSPGKFIAHFSAIFFNGMMALLRTRFANKRVYMNVLYNEFIKDRGHVHMNSTRWTSLSGFCRMLGREGIAEIEESTKGFYVTYRPKDEALQKKQKAAMKKEAMDKSDEQLNDEFLERQMAATTQSVEESNYTELATDRKEKFKFSMGKVDPWVLEQQKRERMAKAALARRPVSEDIAEAEAEGVPMGDDEENGGEDMDAIGRAFIANMNEGTSELNNDVDELIANGDGEGGELDMEGMAEGSDDGEGEEEDGDEAEAGESAAAPMEVDAGGKKDTIVSQPSKSAAAAADSDEDIPLSALAQSAGVGPIGGGAGAHPANVIPVKFLKAKPINVLAAAAVETKEPEKDLKEVPIINNTRKRKLDEVMDDNESTKERTNRKDYWLAEGIVVKIMNKKLKDGAFYKEKGTVRKVIDRYVGEIELVDPDTRKRVTVRIDQQQLETVLPAIGGAVLVVNGAYRGTRATLEEINADKFRATVRVSSGPLTGRVLERMEYEDICKLADGR